MLALLLLASTGASAQSAALQLRCAEAEPSAAGIRDLVQDAGTIALEAYFARCGETAAIALRLTGDIDEPLAAAVRRLQEAVLRNPRTAARIARAEIPVEVTVNSAGGEVGAALAIGEAFRAISAQVVVPAESRCASSCIFLLAGAVDRIVVGKVLIHRPYFTNLAPTPEHRPVRARIAEIDRQILGFLEEMDVARALLDEMKAVPPEALRPLTERELAYFRLSLEDAAQQERRIAQAAWDVGTTSAELRQREVLARRECQADAPAASTCASAIRYGLSVEDYARRETQARTACDGAPDRVAGCRREIMLAR